MISFQQFIFLHQMVARSSINGGAMILCAILAIMIMSYLCQAWWSPEEGTHWTDTPGVPTACGMLWVFIAECYRTGSVWEIYRFHFPPSDVFSNVNFWPTLGYIVAGIIFNVGLLRCIYLFSPPSLRWIGWRFALTLSVGFLAMSQLLP